MAYNSYYPAGYMPQFYGQQMQQQPQQQAPTSGMIWVQGEAGAKSYLVAPNTTVQLWDSEAQVIYLKSADAAGMPSMKIIDYTIRDSTPPMQQKEQAAAYITRSEFDEFKNEVQRMIRSERHESTVSNDERRNRNKA